MKHIITKAKLNHKGLYRTIEHTKEPVEDLELYRKQLFEENKRLIDSVYNPIVDECKPTILFEYDTEE